MASTFIPVARNQFLIFLHLHTCILAYGFNFYIQMNPTFYRFYWTLWNKDCKYNVFCLTGTLTLSDMGCRDCIVPSRGYMFLSDKSIFITFDCFMLAEKLTGKALYVYIAIVRSTHTYTHNVR